MPRAVRVVVGLTVCVVALARCTKMADPSRMGPAITATGYEDVSVSHDTTNGHSLVEIEATSTEETAEDDADRVAQLVWVAYPRPIDELRIVLDGELALEAGADELTSRFGVRPEGLGRPSDSGPNVVMVLVIVACVVAFPVIAILVWRRGRRPPRVLPYPPPLPPGAYQYGPPPPGGP